MYIYLFILPVAIILHLLYLQIRTFVNHTRPVIIIDGAHLKGAYLGTNLMAVAMDGNNDILPLAYGVRVGET